MSGSELLIAPMSYGDLLSGLAGIPTNLLAARLRGLEEDGLVRRERREDDRRRVTYSLASLGAGLEPAVLELVKWGGNWMGAGQGADRFEPRWGVLALRALLSGRRAAIAGSIELSIEGEAVTVLARPDEPLRIVSSSPGPPEAHVSGTGEVLLGLASGKIPMSEGLRRGVRVRGDRGIVRRILQP